MAKVTVDPAWLMAQLDAAPPLDEQAEDGVQPCGTRAAAQRHYRRGEKPCEACRVAQNRSRAEWLARRQPLRPERAPLQPCGTAAAAARHRRHGERLDWDCQEAERAAATARRAARKAAGALT